MATSFNSSLISPGIQLNEVDTSQVTPGPIVVGAAIVGPTVKGPVNVPTVVTNYNQYKALFGGSFTDVNNNSQEYLTSIAAYNYFQQGGQSLLVTRVASGSYTSAEAYVDSYKRITVANDISRYFVQPTGSSNPALSASVVVDSSNKKNLLNFSGSIVDLIEGATYGDNVVLPALKTSASFVLETLSEGRFLNQVNLNASLLISASLPYVSNSIQVSSYLVVASGSANSAAAYTASNTLNDGIYTKAIFSPGTGSLVSGSSNNIRWEIANVNTGSGTFTLRVRQGDDYTSRTKVLEVFNNLSLDPNSPNYIENQIGNQKLVPTQDGDGLWYLQYSGSFANNSNYIRVKSVLAPTPNYLDSLGKPKSEYTASLPLPGSGSLQGAFHSAVGAITSTVTASMFQQIPATTGAPIQGVMAYDYNTAIGLMANKDQYAYNVLYAPGLTLQNAPSQVATMVSNTQDRGDAIVVLDPVSYADQPNMNTVVSTAAAVDSSYAAAYFPWLQMSSPETGKLVYVPASTVIPAAYEYNDRIGQPWFAPAGITRGALPTVLQPQVRLTTSQRDALYEGGVNPIAVFPGQGTVIYGQKTLYSANSALNRVNVRRLLIELKANINTVAQSLLFEPNTIATRNAFLNQVNPYLAYVQQKQGLYAFQVVMDDTNNTADVIDRNQLVGAVYLQPTKTSEFIIIDFNITPTGATFGA